MKEHYLFGNLGASDGLSSVDLGANCNSKANFRKFLLGSVHTLPTHTASYKIKLGMQCTCTAI